MRRVVVVSYDPAWPADYARESAEVGMTVGENLVAIHHIGSTSVPGLAAKPVIDMLAVVAHLDELDSHPGRLKTLGYQVMGEFGNPGRRYFRKDNPAGERTHQVHAFARGSPHVDRHLAFRDFLRAHPHHAAEYGELKRRLAAMHPTSIEDYIDGKDAFIKATEARALAWRAESPPQVPPRG